MKRLLVKVTMTSRYGFTVDVPDEVSTRDVRQWFQSQDFDPRAHDIGEKVVDETVTVSPTERGVEDATFQFDGKELS